MRDPSVARRVWRNFRARDLPASHVVDSTAQQPDETTSLVLSGLAGGRFRMG